MIILNSARELLTSTGLSGAVRTRGWAFATDGASQNWEILPTISDNRLALPTKDGKWAVPTDFLRTPPRPPIREEVLEDVLRRARTFKYEGSTDLKWDGTGRGPMASKEPVHKILPKPYPITCSHFVGMVLAGLEYTSTTYVRDSNVKTGYFVPYGAPAESLNLYQAWLSARWFFINGDMWWSDGTDIAPGDLLFFSHQDPESTYDRVREGKTTPYFGNIYHVSLYMGANTMIQSATPTSPTGVYELSFTKSYKDDFRLAVRPKWRPPMKSLLGLLYNGHENLLHLR